MALIKGNLDMYSHHGQRQDLKPCIIGSMRPWKLSSAPRSVEHATGNPPTRVGVLTIVLSYVRSKTCPKIQNLHEKNCYIALQYPEFKIQNPKSKIWASEAFAI